MYVNPFRLVSGHFPERTFSREDIFQGGLIPERTFSRGDIFQRGLIPGRTFSRGTFSREDFFQKDFFQRGHFPESKLKHLLNQLLLNLETGTVNQCWRLLSDTLQLSLNQPMKLKFGTLKYFGTQMRIQLS